MIDALSTGNTGEPCVLLLSGGVESAFLLWSSRQRGRFVIPLYVSTGHRWEQAEEAAAAAIVSMVGDAPMAAVRSNLSQLYSSHWSRVGAVPDAQTPDEAVRLPGRNAFLLSTAAVLCETETIAHIVHGTLGTNPFPDASPSFFALIAKVISCSLGRDVVIETPLKSATKREVIQSTPPEIAKLTFSCIDPVQGLHCGRCNKCAERRSAFIDAACDDPTRYAVR